MILSEGSEIKRLKEEVRALKSTVVSLKATVEELNRQLAKTKPKPVLHTNAGRYDHVADQGVCIEGDASWARLVGLLQDANRGLTATELAEEWGKSRSRTSEVLNKLVDEGRLVKFRDGREIRFLATDEDEE